MLRALGDRLALLMSTQQFDSDLWALSCVSNASNTAVVRDHMDPRSITRVLGGVPAHTTSAIRTKMNGRSQWQGLLSTSGIQSALCSWRWQYFPSGRGPLASPGLRKVTLVSELVRVQSQLCLETTRVPFPLLYDCSVNFQVNLCKVLSSWNRHTALTFIRHSLWSLPGSVATEVLPLHRDSEAHSFQPSCTTLERGWKRLFEQDHIQICLSSTHTKTNFYFPPSGIKLEPQTKSKKEEKDDII